METQLTADGAAPAATDPSVTVGTLLTQTFTVWKRNLGAFALVALAFQLPGLVLQWAIGSPFLAQPSRLGAPTPEGQAFVMTGRFWAVTGVMIALMFLEAGALCAGAIRDLSGRRAGFGEMVALALQRAIPLLIANTLCSVAMTFGLVALVAPGIVVALMYSLISAVLMMESGSAWRALGRSRALTKGHRAKLLGFFCIVYAAAVTPNFLVPMLAGGVPYLATALNLASGAILGTLFLAAPGVAYHQLRRLKDGAGTAELARVFE